MFETGLYLITTYSTVLAIACWMNMVYGRRSSLVLGIALGLTPYGVLGIVISLAPTHPSFISASFMFSIALAVVSALAARALLTKKPKRWIRQALLVIVLVVLPLMPYAIVESQTYLFGERMRSPIQHGLRESGWFGETRIVSLKVLYLTPKNSLVYIVAALHPGSAQSGYYAGTHKLVRAKGGWKHKTHSEDIVWSDGGSADGTIFPPYPRKGEW